MTNENLSAYWTKLSTKERESIIAYLDVYLGVVVTMASLMFVSRAKVIDAVKTRRDHFKGIGGQYSKNTVEYCDKLLRKLGDT